MRSLSFVLFATALPVVAYGSDLEKQDLKRCQGTWKVQSCIQGGKPDNRLQNVTYVVKGTF
jgi:hypothetical protein